MNKDLEKIHKEIERYREKIKYDTVDYPIESICRRFENKKIIIPNYQREFVWTIDKQSKLIESILMGFPIPFLFFYEDKDKGILEVVDGAQRLQSVYFFLENKLKLEGLKKLKSLNNCYFNDLPEKFKNKFENTALRVILLEEKTNNEFRKEIFNRLNTTSQRLEPIEVLLGTYSDEEFIEFLKRCSKNEKYKKLCPISLEKQKKKENLELVLRFFAYSDSLDEYDGKVTLFLEDYVKKNLRDFDRERLLKNFENMLVFVEKYFPNGFAKSKSAKSTPRTRFEAISVGVNLALNENKNLNTNTEEWLESKEFKKVTTTDSANNKSKLVERIEFVKNKLLGDNIHHDIRI